MAKNKKISEEKVEYKQVPIDWHVPEGIPTPFATNMVVQFTEGVFKLSFFESKPPIELDGKAPPPDKIRADYVGGVIVTASKMPRFIQVLQDHYEKFRSVAEK